MRYKFLIKDFDGFSHCLVKDCENTNVAKEIAQKMCDDVNFVDTVTLTRMLSNDTCGEQEYIGDFKYGEQ